MTGKGPDQSGRVSGAPAVVPVQPREAWDARPPRGPVHVIDESVERVAFVVHWLGPAPHVTDPRRRLSMAQAFHQSPERGWADVGYNAAVGLDGSAYVARGWAAVGAHAPGYNRKAYGCVVLMGSGESITGPALTALASTYWTACSRAGRPLQLLDHAATGRGTECAGDALRHVLSVWQRLGVPRVPEPDPVKASGKGKRPAPPYRGPLFAVTCNDAARQWQARMVERGWALTVDGVYGRQSAEVCRAFQRDKRLTVDGVVGPRTWAATWGAPIT